MSSLWSIPCAGKACYFGRINGGEILGGRLLKEPPVEHGVIAGKLSGEKSWRILGDGAVFGLEVSGLIESHVRTFDGRVFEIELLFGGDREERTQEISRKLSMCASRVNEECWVDDQGNYYLPKVFPTGVSLMVGQPKLFPPRFRQLPRICKGGVGS